MRLVDLGSKDGPPKSTQFSPLKSAPYPHPNIWLPSQIQQSPKTWRLMAHVITPATLLHDACREFS